MCGATVPGEAWECGKCGRSAFSNFREFAKEATPPPPRPRVVEPVLTSCPFCSAGKVEVECERCFGLGIFNCAHYEHRLEKSDYFCREGTKTCGRCKGNGFRMVEGFWNPKRVACIDCEGKGRVNCEHCKGKGNEPCPLCKGAGNLGARPCDDCGGAGEVDLATSGRKLIKKLRNALQSLEEELEVATERTQHLTPKQAPAEGWDGWDERDAFDACEIRCLNTQIQF